MSGVRSVDVSVARGTVTVSHDQTDAVEMTSRISALGYTVAEGEKTVPLSVSKKVRDRGSEITPAILTNMITAAGRPIDDGGRPARPG
ncbi:hypothetical protein ACRQ5Q_07475 [Bradyrhizobium sp. PMVTL-01]|uniref:hypothetical protein n=1 Tax=Bradyrhizobium sp. PMVTL-01 TaxID=3434999 RepID=UPI003F7182BD